MGQQRRYQKLSPVGIYDYAHITAIAGSDTEIGVVGKGTFLGSVIVGNAGASAVLTLKNGADVIAVIHLSSSIGQYDFNLALDNGLFYQLSVASDVTITYLDYVE